MRNLDKVPVSGEEFSEFAVGLWYSILLFPAMVAYYYGDIIVMLCSIVYSVGVIALAGRFYPETFCKFIIGKFFRIRK